MTDHELRRLLREAFRPIDDAAPSHDLWPSVAARRKPRAVPAWFDVALAAATLAIFLVRPDWLLLAAYFFF